MFISIQSPDAANGSTNQIDAAGQAIAFDNHITLVISRLENLGN
jgi:hypothetical protein